MDASPYSRARAMFAAIAAAMVLPLEKRQERIRDVGGWKSRGKGGKHRAQHAGARKVAWDKRDARKRRNRLRAKRR